MFNSHWIIKLPHNVSGARVPRTRIWISVLGANGWASIDASWFRDRDIVTLFNLKRLLQHHLWKSIHCPRHAIAGSRGKTTWIWIHSGVAYKKIKRMQGDKSTRKIKRLDWIASAEWDGEAWNRGRGCPATEVIWHMAS